MWDIPSASVRSWASWSRCFCSPAARWFSAAWGSTVGHQGPEQRDNNTNRSGSHVYVTTCFQRLQPKRWTHQGWDGVVKQLSIFTDCLSNIRTPALLQFALAPSDQMFEVNVSDELVGLIHHSLRDANTDFSVWPEEHFSIFPLCCSKC